MNEAYTCRKVTKNDDWHQLCHLICIADPYLYVDLFGSEKTAQKVLSILMGDPHSIFFYKNYYVVESEGEILGMAAFYKNKPCWNREDVIAAFYETGMEVPKSFDEASIYFDSTFNLMKVGISACNIVVDEKHRGKGIANVLLNYILKLSARSPIELNVIKDNVPAVNLYRKFGFRVIEEYKDYGGYGKPEISCYRMYYPGISDSE